MKKDITLQEGLNQFREKNGKYFSERQTSPEAEQFLLCHDIAHVVFDCDTSIYGEGVVKIWTTFGSTLGFWQVIKGYNEASAFELFKLYSYGHVFRNIMKYLAVIPKAIVRAKKMSKPWPFHNYTPYLDTPLSTIRREFNIKVLK